MRKCEVRVALAAAIAGNDRLTSPVVAASTPKGVAAVAAVTIRHVIKLPLALSGSANHQRKSQGSVLLEGLGQFTLEPRILTCKLRAIRRGRRASRGGGGAEEEEEAAEDEPEEEEEEAVAEEADECEDKSEAATSCSI